MKNAIRLNIALTPNLSRISQAAKFFPGKQSPASSDRFKRRINVFSHCSVRADREADGDPVVHLSLVDQSKTLVLHTLHDLSIKVVELLLSLAFVGRQTVRQVAEAIESRCWLTEHFEVRVFADEVM
jgi:hypothetical protein